MDNEFSRTMRDDPSGPELIAYLETVLGGMAIDRHKLEDEAVNQMSMAKGAGSEFIKATQQLADAEGKRDNMYATLADEARGTGEKFATEAALKARVNRDPRMVKADTAHQNAVNRLEAAKLVMKFYWERGENIRALLFSRNTEMRALGAPASGGGTTSALTAPAAGDLTRRANAKYTKKG